MVIVDYGQTTRSIVARGHMVRFVARAIGTGLFALSGAQKRHIECCAAKTVTQN